MRLGCLPRVLVGFLFGAGLLAFAGEPRAPAQSEASGSSVASAGARVSSIGTVEVAARSTLRCFKFVAPVDGRAVPPDSHGDDLWFQHVAIVVSDTGRSRCAWKMSEPSALLRRRAAAGG